MRLNCCFLLIVCFVLFIQFANARDQDVNHESNDNQQDNQPKSIKKSEDDENRQTQSGKQESPIDKTTADHLDDHTNDNDNLNDPVDEYIYIKIKSLDSDDKLNKDSEEIDTNEFKDADSEQLPTSKRTTKDSPIRKTLNIIYDENDDKAQQKFEKLENDQAVNDEDGSKEKEIMVSTYPTIDLVKVQFKKNENIKKIPEDDDEEPPKPELTKEQALGKQLFDDALTRLESNNMYAYKLIDQAAMLGYKEAIEFLLHGLVFGDFDFGLTVLKEKLDYYSRRGNPLAQMFYGFFYASGIFFKPSQANALLYYTVSSAANNTYSQMALGYRYWHGINVKQNCQKALKYYRKVAKQVERTMSTMSTIPGGIIERKRLFDENENPTSYTVLNPDMIQYYQVLAENGDTLAQIAVGQIHYQGMRGVPKDHRKALKFLKMAADSKNSNAMAYLGKMYLEGGSDAIEQNYELAKDYFTSAIEKNSAAGYCGLGTMYLYGKGVEKDYAKAFRFFNKAAEQGLVEAQYQIGIMYYNGYGVAQNYQDAFKYFYLASQAGYVLGFYYLAIMHAEGNEFVVCLNF